MNEDADMSAKGQRSSMAATCVSKRRTRDHDLLKDGAVIFKQDCAVCHGESAKGDGPAAKDLKAHPPNLTTLAQRHGGEFPKGYVLDVLHNGVNAPAHGTVEMPVWGPMFDTMNRDNQAQSKLRINNLVTYLQSIQEK
jgi:mono/diheme cytochrome c family protein